MLKTLHPDHQKLILLLTNSCFVGINMYGVYTHCFFKYAYWVFGKLI